MFLNWIKCKNGWCSFSNVDLESSHFDGMKGVYIIFGGDGKVVRVGQGTIKDRISVHRNDPLVTRHEPMRVTWAEVPVLSRDGVERFLAKTLQPLIGDAFPNAVPIKVNLPE